MENSPHTQQKLIACVFVCVAWCVATNFLGKFKKQKEFSEFRRAGGDEQGFSAIIKHTFYAANETLVVYI